MPLHNKQAAAYGPGMILRMAILFLAMVAATIIWARDTGLTDGRFMYPALAAALILIWLGLGEWAGPRASKWLAIALGGASYALAWGFLIVVLVPANRMPRVDAFPDRMETLGWRAAGVELTGYDLPEGVTLGPGDDLTVRLYWTALEPPPDEYLVAVVQLGALADPQIVLAQADHLAGGTIFPTTEWRPGDRITQEVRLRLREKGAMPGVYFVRVALRPYDAFSQTPRLALTGPDGATEELITLDRPVRVLSPVEKAAHSADAPFGDVITLRGWSASTVEGGQRVDLIWEVRAATPVNLTVFVHALGPDGTLAAQHDSIPVNGNFPAWAWAPGDVFVDSHWLALPSLEGLRVLVGLYDPATGQRLPVPGSAEGTYQLIP